MGVGRHFQLSGVFVLILVLSACGGELENNTGSSKLSYTGNRSLASIDSNNAGSLVANLIASDSFGFLLDGNLRRDNLPPLDTPRQISVAEAAHYIRKFSERVLNSFDGGLFIRNSAAVRTFIDGADACHSGIVRVSGELDNTNLSGQLNIDFQNCRLIDITLDGSLDWDILAVDPVYRAPSHSVFNISSIRLTGPMFELAVGGTIHNLLYFSTGSENLLLTNFVSVNEVTGDQVLASKLHLHVEYDDIFWPTVALHTIVSGRIFDSTYGYVNVISSKALRYDGRQEPYPVAGNLGLAASGAIDVNVLSNSFVLLKIDADDLNDESFDFIGIVPWDMLNPPFENSQL